MGDKGKKDKGKKEHQKKAQRSPKEKQRKRKRKRKRTRNKLNILSTIKKPRRNAGFFFARHHSRP